MLRALMHRNGYVSVMASNGREAIEILRKRADFTAIILDLMMPEVDGRAVIDFLVSLLLWFQYDSRATGERIFQFRWTVDVCPKGTRCLNRASDPKAHSNPVPGSKFTERKICTSAYFGKSTVVVLSATVRFPERRAEAR